MIKKEFVFFSVNDFSKDGGGTIRMLGILNELAEQGHHVTFLSNAQRLELFHPSIKHTHINFAVSPTDKRRMQSVLAFAPAVVLNRLYPSLLHRLKELFLPLQHSTVYFFEYLDNTIGYWLYRNGLIGGYINDLHGAAVLEFEFQYRTASIGRKKFELYSKYIGAKRLDKKVFDNAQGLIYASKAMQNYYRRTIPSTTGKQSLILPYVLDKKQLIAEVDPVLRLQLQENFKITPDEKIVFFAGVFKKTGGVPDLVRAVSMLGDLKLKLILVGDGATLEECKGIVSTLGLTNVCFAGRVPYGDLRTYQSLANIIVCPDRDNVYSQLIIHVKYLDALISGKIVVNGAFESVLEINENEKLSLMFKPSDVESLAQAIRKGITQEIALLEKYRNNLDYIRENLTYQTAIRVLTGTR